MDAARIGEFARYDVAVFASFVADLWERAGFDCVFVDPAETDGANVIGRRYGGGSIRILATLEPHDGVAGRLSSGRRGSDQSRIDVVAASKDKAFLAERTDEA